MGWLLNAPLALKCWGPSGGRRPRRSPSGGRRRCGRRGSCDITIIPRIRTGLRRSSRMRSGREAWRSGSAAVIKAATGCLRHTLARTAERRAVQQPDYPAAAGDLQELASVTVCARQPRRAALRPSRPTHSQAARARHFSDLVIRLAMSAHRGKADLAESMMAQSCFGGGTHCIEQAARAIAGRLIPQLPARRRFHRTLLISAGPSSWTRAAVPYRAVRMAGFDGASAKIRTTIDTLELKMRLAIAISN